MIYDEVKQVIEDHLYNQPYAVKCSECGDEMEILQTDVDNDGDMTVTVTPCNCKKGDPNEKPTFDGHLGLA